MGGDNFGMGERKGDEMSDTEQRDRFDLWWDQYCATALRVSTDGVRFTLAETNRSVAKKAWMESARQTTATITSEDRKAGA